MKKFSRKVRKAVKVLSSKELVLEKGKNAEYKKEIDDLNASIDYLAEQKVLADEEKNELKSDIEKYQKTIIELQKEKQEMTTRANQYFISIIKQKQRCNALEDTIAETIEKAEEYHDKVVELQKQLDEARKPLWRKVLKC